jgi:hypothetical protein
MFVTLLSSIGFHYYETVNQSLQLQWLRQEEGAADAGLAAVSGIGGDAAGLPADRPDMARL